MDQRKVIERGTVVVKGSRIACVGVVQHGGRRQRDRRGRQDDHPRLGRHARAPLSRVARHAAEARLRAGDLSRVRRDDDARSVDVQRQNMFPTAELIEAGEHDRTARLQHRRQHHRRRRRARERDQQPGRRARDGAQDGRLGRGVDQAVRAAAPRSAPVDGGSGAHGRHRTRRPRAATSWKTSASSWMARRAGSTRSARCRCTPTARSSSAKRARRTRRRSSSPARRVEHRVLVPAERRVEGSEAAPLVPVARAGAADAHSLAASRDGLQLSARRAGDGRHHRRRRPWRDGRARRAPRHRVRTGRCGWARAR